MRMKVIFAVGILALCLSPVAANYAVAQNGSAAGSSAGSSTDGNGAPAELPPIDKLVTMTCRQAWHAGGKTQDGFFAIVEQLTALSAQNRHVTIPDDQAAGAKAGEWIRTQAMKDPDQLLYAVVDHAVQYSINKGKATPATSARKVPAQ